MRAYTYIIIYKKLLLFYIKTKAATWQTARIQFSKKPLSYRENSGSKQNCSRAVLCYIPVCQHRYSTVAIWQKSIAALLQCCLIHTHICSYQHCGSTVIRIAAKIHNSTVADPPRENYSFNGAVAVRLRASMPQKPCVYSINAVLLPR